tara:strand:- start:237 stop:719 length:483 start_codon:yes stop_codon:yes gene_type:complete
LDPATVLATVKVGLSAAQTVKKILHEGHDIAMAASRLSTFFDAKDKLLEASQQVENPSLLAKTFGAKSIKGQALAITLQRKKMQEVETELKELFLYTGNMPWYEDYQDEIKRIRRARAVEARRKAQARAAFLDGITILAILLLTIGSTIGFAVFYKEVVM